MRFVVDTNVLISALIKPQSVPGQALFQCRQKGTLLFSEETKGELFSVIQRPRFTRYIDPNWIVEQANQIVQQAEVVKIASAIKIECRDLTDVKFFQLAVDAKANCLISGDFDLLEKNMVLGVPVMTPSYFLVWLSAHNG